VAVEIPLFPLGVVLFPHMPLPLHIFEERYREMMRDCQESGVGFGVVAIREGREVGAAAEPFRVGTLARLRSVERLDDGRFNILVTGATRYRISRVTLERAYLVGEVEYLEDRSGDPVRLSRLRSRVAEAFQRYADELRRLADEAPATLDLPDDPELLSYLVAATMQVEVARKQELLEIDAAEDRLRACLTLLQREAALLDRMLARRDVRAAVISPN
jgi:Lon protease-like protein